MVRLEPFPCRTFLRQRLFGMPDRGIKIGKGGPGDLQILLFEPECQTPVRTPCVRKKRHELFYGFQTFFQ